MLKGKNLFFLLAIAGVAYYYLVWERSAKDKKNDAAKAKAKSDATNSGNQDMNADGRGRFQFKGSKLVVKLGKKY